MKKIVDILGKSYRHLMHDSMHRNSSLLILSQLVAAGCTFLFWVINARIFSTNDVGLATAFVSFGMLVATFTNLGLPNTVVRFIATSKRRGGLFTASLLLVTGASLVGGAIALFLAGSQFKNFTFITESPSLSAVLLLLIFGAACNGLVESALIAFRKGEQVLVKALVTNLPRIVLPFLVVSSGVVGMTSIYAVTLLVGVGYNLFIIFARLLNSDQFKPALGELNKHRAYTVSNYLGSMFGILPSTLVPIIVLSVLGASAAAYFYMPMMIATLLSVISGSVSQSLISECSQTDDEVKQREFFIQALRHMYQLLTPAVVLLLLIGWPILRVYGAAYASSGYLPLAILLFSSLIVGINWLGDTWLNIKKRSRDYFLMNAFNALAVVVSVYFFAQHGLVGAALGWLLGQALSAIVYGLIFARSQIFRLTLFS